ncbi:MAG: hypothetical protein IPI41_08805 [Flavobacteriales bacterium]|nr:hypothetical protein [Flavobacteriales bacterium]
MNGLIGLYHKKMLFTSGQVADALILGYDEEDVEGDFAFTFYSSYDYEFYDQNGVRVHGSQTQNDENPLNIVVENCPCPARVVYLASNSNINALRMPGTGSWVEFIWDSGFLWKIFTLAIYAVAAYQVMRYFYPLR